MNYGKNNISKKKKKISSKKRMKKKRLGVRLFKAIIICILLLAVICVVGGCVLVKHIVDNTPTVTAEDILPKGYTTNIVDQNGTVLRTLNDSDSNRVYKTYDEIPEYLAHAFVAIEDERFYDHNGVDLQGIIRAGFVGITNGFNFTEGASTITQQLIKNNVFPDFINESAYERVERKIQEIYLALQIEQQMSKEEILEAYMNTINLSQGCLGVQTASLRYFNKDVSELTLSECAVLAAITNRPAYYDPVTHPENNASRRERILKLMLEQGYITQEEHDEALADNVYDRILETASNTTSSEPYSYFVDALIEQVVEDLVNEKGYTQAQAYNLLYSGGLTIRATQDSEIQKICDEEVDDLEELIPGVEYGVEYALTIHREDGSAENYSKEMFETYYKDAHDVSYVNFDSEDEARAAIEEYKSTLNITEKDKVDENLEITPQPQVSIVIMDQYTGQVKAIVGGRGEKTSNLSLNRATGSYRQPGSVFKILSTYAPALDSGDMTLASIIPDEPYEYKDGTPVNNVNHRYAGDVTMRYAIQQSINTCAVRTLTEDVGEEESYDFLLNLGFTTLNEEDRYSQSKALGGLNLGVYNIELTAAFAALANGGVYTEPTFYTEILDHDGNVLIDNTSPETKQVVKDSTAYLLTSAMEDVVNQGTGAAARLDDMTAAGKTGTTTNYVDLWFAGYTPYYTGAVWGGYDNNKPMSSSNSRWRNQLWKRIMDRVHEGLENKEFEVPSSVERKSICTRTGLLAVSSCPSVTEYFATDSLPTQSCSGHYVAPDPEPVTPDETTENNNGNTTDDGNNTSGITDPNTGGNTGNGNGGNTGTGDNGGNTGTGDNGGNTGTGDTGNTGTGDNGGNTGTGDNGGNTGTGDNGGNTGGGSTGGETTQ